MLNIVLDVTKKQIKQTINKTIIAFSPAYKRPYIVYNAYNINIRDYILDINISTPRDVLLELSERFRSRRLALHLTQEGLASRAGMSTSSLKRFEHTGQKTWFKKSGTYNRSSTLCCWKMTCIC